MDFHLGRQTFSFQRGAFSDSAHDVTQAQRIYVKQPCQCFFTATGVWVYAWPFHCYFSEKKSFVVLFIYVICVLFIFLNAVYVICLLLSWTFHWEGAESIYARTTL